MSEFSIRNYNPDNQPTPAKPYGTTPFMQERTDFIKYLNKQVALIEREGASLLKLMNEKTQQKFGEKLDAWRNLVHYIDVLTRLYEIKIES